MKGKSLRFKAISAILIFMFVFAGCGSKKDEAAQQSPSTALNKQEIMDKAKSEDVQVKPEDSKIGEKPATNDGTNANKIRAIDNERKIIKAGSTTIETVKFEESLNSILKEIEEKGGYIENSNIHGSSDKNQLYNDNVKRNYSENRSASIIARVPKEAFDGFLKDASKFGNVISKSVNGEDVTAQYFDTEARLKTLKIQEERILELLKKSGDLKDIIELEKRLSELRFEIESLTGTLKKWDNMVSYSQVSINLIEVVELTPNEKTPITLGDKIIAALKNSTKGLIDLCKSFLVFIALILPYVVVIIAVAFLISFLKKKLNIKGFKIKLPFKTKK